MDEKQEVPCNIEAELAFLASVIRNNSELPSVLAILKPSDFYNVANQMVFEAIVSLAERNEPIDPLTVNNELIHLGNFAKAGGEAYIPNLLQNGLVSERLEVYARIIIDCAARRRVIWAGEQLVTMARNNAPLSKIRERGEHWLSQSTPMLTKSVDHIGSALDEALGYLEQIENGKTQLFLPCMLRDVERKLGGYTRGEITVYANFTGNGKTAWAIQEALDKARRGFSVLYVSTEVYRHVIANRLISQIRQINFTQAQYGWKQEHVTERLPYGCPDKETFSKEYRLGHEQLRELPIHFLAKSRDPKTGYVNSPSMTPTSIRSETRRYAEKHGIDFVVLDYITDMDMPQGDGGYRSLVVAQGLRTIREGVNDVGAAGLALAQYTRDAKNSETPELHHLEQSTGIEKGSDNVWLGYSPDSNNEAWQVIKGGKGRNRSKGAIEGLHFNGYIQTFTDNYIRGQALQNNEPPHPDNYDDDF